MEVKNQIDDKRGRFYMEAEGKQIGKMEYVFSGDTKMIIEHTEVNPAYEGKGLGMQLVKAGVAYAREHHIKILPVMFAAKSFRKIAGGCVGFW